MTTLNGIGNRVSARTEYSVNGAQYINYNGFGPRDYDKWRMDWNGNHGIAPPDVGTVLWLPGQPGAGSTVIDYSSNVLDVGSAAINRAAFSLSGSTYIDLANSVDFTGYISSVQVWATAAMTGFRVGTFYLVSGTTYTCRDSATIGAVASGSAQTFGGLHIRAVVGDLIGCHFDTGTIETALSGGSGIKSLASESIDPGDSADFGATSSGKSISLYAVGESSFGNNGALTGTTWGRLPSGLSYLNFDGDDLVSVTNSVSLDVTSDLTLLTWLWLDTLNATEMDFMQNGTGAENGFFFDTRGSDGEFQYGKQNVAAYVTTATGLATTGSWYQMAATQTGGNCVIYKNAVSVGTASGKASVAAPSNPLTLGGTSAGQKLQGRMALTRVFNVALTADQVANIYNRERHLFGA